MAKHLYIYEYISKLTTSQHHEGGLLIITSGDPSEAWRAHLERVAAEHPSNKIYLDPDRIRRTLPKPDRVIPVSDTEADTVTVFPDAGCC